MNKNGYFSGEDGKELQIHRRTDRVTYDDDLVARALEELDKEKSLRDVSNDLHIPKIPFRKARENYYNKTNELDFQPRDLYKTRQVGRTITFEFFLSIFP